MFDEPNRELEEVDGENRWHFLMPCEWIFQYKLQMAFLTLGIFMI
tara:strand:+ start:298 stop:432 length:135 start_codon:yes stop_codon:yes gene_type:complete